MRPLRVPFFASLLLGASAALGSLAACVGDDPTPVGPAATEDASPPSAEAGQDSASTPETSTPDSGDAADEAAPKRFCATQAPLTGVTDFFCADFDGTKADEGFTKANVPDGGALTLSTDAFFSAPASHTNSGDATLVYEKVGGAAFLEAQVDVRINVGNLGGVVPPSTGYVTILKLSSIDTNVELRYTNGATVEGATYTGYYVNAAFCPNACGVVEKKLSNQLPTNVWTDVQLIWQKTGSVKVNLNGLPVLDLGGAATTSTKISATLGVVSVGAPVGVGRHAYDNFVVSVKR